MEKRGGIAPAWTTSPSKHPLPVEQLVLELHLILELPGGLLQQRLSLTGSEPGFFLFLVEHDLLDIVLE